MKITVASLVTLACLTVGPAGAIPVDSIYDRATNARPHTEDDSPLKALHATPTSHRMSHTCTDTHIEPRASSVTFADGDSETDEDTEPPVVTGTPTSHHMGPSCTTIPRGPANAGPTAGIEVPNDGVDMTPPRGVATRPKSPVAPLVPEPLTRKAQSEGHLRSATDAGTVGQAHKRSDPGSKTPSISMPALQPSPTGQSEWIHGTCTKRKGDDPHGTCHFEPQGRDGIDKMPCSQELPCGHLGSCIVHYYTSPRDEFASCS